MTAQSATLVDDGATRHLKRGRRLPDIALPTTTGRLTRQMFRDVFAAIRAHLDARTASN